MFYWVDYVDGVCLVVDLRIGVMGYMGSWYVGLWLKELVDVVGKLIYLEFLFINFVIMLFGVFCECLD